MTQRFANSILAAGLCLTASVAILSNAEARTRAAKPQRQAAIAEPELKPQGPLTIVVSIARQHLTVYDGLKPIASTTVSTGVDGHNTPLGVFSVIQKDRFHRSNLYNDAPMPFMQRITWSGVALHEGHVTGRPASHGCIRLPQAFAMKLWKLTKLGARVIVTMDEISLAEIDAPKLLTPRPQVDVALAIEPPALPYFPPIPAVETVASIRREPGDPALWIEAAAEPFFPAELLPQPPADLVLALPIDPPATLAFPGLEPAAPIVAHAFAELPANLGIELAEPPAVPAFEVAEAPAPLPAAEQLAMVDLSLPAGFAPPKSFNIDKAAGPIAIFISKREGKLFVRQNFKPIYDVKVAFNIDDAALGTHVFTALPGDNPASGVRWSVTTVPSALALQQERERVARATRKPVKTQGVQVASRSDAVFSERILSAREALERVSIPDEARDILAAAITPGSSLIVSDLGFGTETGRGTDFIVQAK